MIEIIEKIMLHGRVYELMGEVIPPYRITCEEHKILFDYIWHNESLPKSIIEQKDRRIKSYLGIGLQLVTFVESYS